MHRLTIPGSAEGEGERGGGGLKKARCSSSGVIEWLPVIAIKRIDGMMSSA